MMAPADGRKIRGDLIVLGIHKLGFKKAVSAVQIKDKIFNPGKIPRFYARLLKRIVRQAEAGVSLIRRIELHHELLVVIVDLNVFRDFGRHRGFEKPGKIRGVRGGQPAVERRRSNA